MFSNSFTYTGLKLCYPFFKVLSIIFFMLRNFSILIPVEFSFLLFIFLELFLLSLANKNNKSFHLKLLKHIDSYQLNEWNWKLDEKKHFDAWKLNFFFSYAVCWMNVKNFHLNFNHWKFTGIIPMELPVFLCFPFNFPPYTVFFHLNQRVNFKI